MNRKDEILAKSRNENKDKDLFETEVEVKGRNIGAVLSALLGIVFIVTQLLVGDGVNHGFAALTFSIGATVCTVKAIRMKRKSDIALAVFLVILTLLLSFNHIYGLITGSAIL